MGSEPEEPRRVAAGLAAAVLDHQAQDGTGVPASALILSADR